MGLKERSGPMAAAIALLGVAVACKSGGSEGFSSANKVFQQHCMPCHAADKKSGGLSLESVEGILRGGASGPAVVPGDALRSLLTKRLRGLDGMKVMPPGVGPIDEAQIRLVEAWIVAGAKA